MEQFSFQDKLDTMIDIAQRINPKWSKENLYSLFMSTDEMKKMYQGNRDSATVTLHNIGLELVEKGCELGKYFNKEYF